MKAWLIQIDAWNGADAVAIRMASHDDERLCHLDGRTWWPVIEKLPTLRYDFFDGSFDAASITSPSGSFDAAIEAIPALPTLAIHDARIRIWGGQLGDAFAAFDLTFDGRVKEQPSASDGAMSINIGAYDSWLDQPLLKTYAGTGGAEGGADLEGQVKPLALGAPRFASATLVDAVDYIYQLSGYGPLHAVETAFERVNRFAAAAGDAGNFAGLKAAEIKRGEWATCLAGGFLRFGAPTDGMLSFHVQGDAQGGWSRLPGDLCRRVAEIAGGAGRIAAADVAAINVARPWPLSIMVTAQTTARDLIQRIAMSVNAVAYVDWLGVLRIAALGIGSPSLTMAADGSALPPVAEVSQVEVNAPYWKIAQGAAVTWQVHGLNDIAFSAPLNPRGPFDPAETYREGDMVTLANGSQWLFVGSAPATGAPPVDGNDIWFRLSDAITAANVTYGDGTSVEALKPAESNATNGAIPGYNIFFPDIPEIPMPAGLLRNDLLSLRADGTLEYQPYPDNEDIKVALGKVAVPDVAGQLALLPDGTLQFETDGVITVLGRISLPDIGAASDTSRRALESALDQISATVARVVSEASETRATFRDAGFYVDPATGQVRISAIDQTRERVNTAELRIDATNATVALKATTSYVDNRFAQALLDPTQFPIYDGIELRVTDVEVRLSGAEASIEQKATVIDLNLMGGRVGTAEQKINALEGQISLKVDSTEFNAVEARVATAEQTIEALGDAASITQAITAVRMLPIAAADAHESALRALLNGDASNLYQIASIASARTELTAKINDDLSAEVRSRMALAVRVGAAEATALEETQIRASETQAITFRVTQLTSQFNDSTAKFTAQIATLSTDTEALAGRAERLETQVGDAEAAIEREEAARIAEDGVISATARAAVTAARGLNVDVDKALDIMTSTLLHGDARSRELSGALAAARDEITAKINSDVDAVIGRVQLLLARINGADAAIILEQVARAAQGEAFARQIFLLSASVEGSTGRFTEQIAALAEASQAATDSIREMESDIGDNASAIRDEASTRADAIGEVEAAARRTVSAVRNVDSSASAAAEQALRSLLMGDAAQRDATSAIAAAREEVTAKINDDVGVVVQSVRALLARLGLAEASIILIEIARATAEQAIVSRLNQMSASIDKTTADLRTEEVARAEEDEAQASRTDAIMARIGEEGAADAIEALIESAAIAFAGPLGAQAERIDNLGARLGEQDAPGSIEARIEGAATAFAGPLQAVAEVTDDIAARMGALGAADSIEARIAEASISFVAPLEAIAQTTEETAARLGAPDTPGSLEARLAAATTAYVEPLRAQAEFSEEISARLGTPNTAGSLEARLEAASKAYVTDVQAQAERTDSVIARIGAEGDPDSIEAKIEDTREVLADVEGKLTARVRIAAVADDTVYLELVADAYAGSIIKLGGDVLALGTVTADKFVSNALIVPAYVWMNGPLNGPGWDNGDTGSGGVGGGTGGGGGSGGGQIP